MLVPKLICLAHFDGTKIIYPFLFQGRTPRGRWARSWSRLWYSKSWLGLLQEGGKWNVFMLIHVEFEYVKIAACLMDGKTRWSGDLGGSQVKWAMSDGIYANPSWYPGVTPQSPFTMFQDREESRFGTNAWTKVLESSCIPSWWFEPPSQNVVSPHIWIFDRHALVLVAAVTLSLSLSLISQQAR